MNRDADTTWIPTSGGLPGQPYPPGLAGESSATASGVYGDPTGTQPAPAAPAATTATTAATTAGHPATPPGPQPAPAMHATPTPSRAPATRPAVRGPNLVAIMVGLLAVVTAAGAITQGVSHGAYDWSAWIPMLVTGAGVTMLVIGTVTLGMRLRGRRGR